MTSKLLKYGAVLFASVFLMSAAAVSGTDPAEAKVRVKTNIIYYDVAGSTGLELAKSMIKRGPKASGLQHAIASMKPDLKFGKPIPMVQGRYCKIKDVDIAVTITYTYPRWPGYKNGTREMQKAWRDLEKELVRHEETHGRILVETANKIYREILRDRGRVSKDCEDFGGRIARRMPMIVKHYQRRQEGFDRREQSYISRVSRLQRGLIKAN